MPVIELENLTKSYDELTAVKGIDLTVEEEEIFGFLGPNGAGKSTTINIILDFMRPTSGTASVFGLDAQMDSLAIRRRSGFLPEGYDVYDRLTARRHLEFAIEAKGRGGDPDELLDRVGLLEDGDRKAGGFSKGMQQRLALALALIGEPDLLILDEPSAGLDPNAAREMLDIIREENERGATIFFSSHILEHVETICDRVAILHEGEIVATNTVEGLRGSLGAAGEISFVVEELTDAAVDAVGALDGIDRVRHSGNTIEVTCPNRHKIDVAEALLREGVTVHDIKTSDMSLEELFAAYTSEGEATIDVARDGQQTAEVTGDA